MHKPFDLEAAKRGELVEFLTADTNRWVPVHFVGTDECGRAVVQRLGDGPIFCPQRESCHIRMASNKVTVRYRVGYFIRAGEIVPYNAFVQSYADIAERATDFGDWLTEWQEVEVPQ